MVVAKPARNFASSGSNGRNFENTYFIIKHIRLKLIKFSKW